MITTVTSKGQVTIPAEARRKLGLRTGSKLQVVIRDDNRLEVIPLATSVRSVKGMLPKPPTPLSLADMEKAMAEGARH